VTRTATTTALRAGRGSDGGDGEAESDELGEGHGFSADFGASWAVASLEIRTVGLGRSTVASWRVGPVDSGGGGRWARWRWATGPPRARGAELGHGGRALGRRGAGAERRRATRSWAAGARTGPRKGKGRWAEQGGKEEEKGLGWAGRMGQGRGETDFLSLFFLFFYYFSLTLCENC
jgi:hypothetical protein